MDERATEAVPPAGMRIAACVQQSVVIVFLLGAVVPLVTAAIGTGDYAGLLDPGLERFDDPKVWIPPVGPDSVWNPLTWAFGIARAAAIFIAPFAVLAVLFGLAYLPRPEVWAHRPAAERLAIWTLLCFALVVFTLTPYFAQLQNWLLD
ncbi:hypothetical protein [Micromonospora sp. NPDC049679]|uniref:hypothetical protein n=1 Tax=Micromonospora sp. NPDC049679 TaxID=3155920 RepID=UPI0033C2BAB4